MARVISARSTQDEKLRELIMYVAYKGEDDPRLGAVKLNKLLYYADFTAYKTLGKSISGAEYQHLPEGPAPRRVLPAIEALKEDEAIVYEYRPTIMGEPLHKIIPKRKYHPLFSKAERDIINTIIKKYWQMTGTELSKLSHKEFGWRLTRDRETIHYRTAWLSSAPLTEEQKEMGRKVAMRHGSTI